VEIRFTATLEEGANHLNCLVNERIQGGTECCYILEVQKRIVIHECCGILKHTYDYEFMIDYRSYTHNLI